MIMANSYSFIHNTGLTEENSLVHLLDAISPQEENEADIIEHSKYYDDKDFINALQSYNSKISMLSLNCQSISAKFDKMKLFLDDVNNQNPISIICIQETWGHEGIQMNYFSLPNYMKCEVETWYGENGDPAAISPSTSWALAPHATRMKGRS